MLVYDVTQEKSFDNIRNWIRNIEEVSHTCFSHSHVHLAMVYVTVIGL